LPQWRAALKDNLMSLTRTNVCDIIMVKNGGAYMGRDYISSQKTAAVIPCYENGNVVRLISADGEQTIINKSIKSVLNDMQKSNNLDIKALRENFGGITGRKNIIPIPLSFECVLIPIKVRKALAVNDGSYAYVNLCYIEEIHERDGCKVSLKCGTIIKSLETKKTIQKRIDIANIMKERVAKGFLGDDFIREVAIDIAMEYDKPATKADIAIIARELLLIKESLLQNYYKKD